MEKVTRYKTFDGMLHTNRKYALSHLYRMYGDKISSIAAKIVSLEKYGKIQDFIDENLDLFLELAKIKSDMEIPDTQNEDE